MVEEIFSGLPESYRRGTIEETLIYYYSVGTLRKTVTLGPDGCRVEEGRTVDNADCVCKTSEELFLRIWNEGYRPGMKDFLSGAIRSNDPAALKAFLAAFGKAA